MKEDIHGHVFHGNIILFLFLSKEECKDLQDRTVGRHGISYMEFFDVVAYHPIPEFIVIKDSETTYLTRFSDFHWKEDAFTFTLYAIKPVYFAMGELYQDELIYKKESLKDHTCIFLKHQRKKEEVK